jgi:transketolase-like protein
VLPSAVTARVAVEAGISQGWHKWIGDKGELVTLDHYGASAPAPKLMEEFGFTVEHVIEKALSVIQKSQQQMKIAVAENHTRFPRKDQAFINLERVCQNHYVIT